MSSLISLRELRQAAKDSVPGSPAEYDALSGFVQLTASEVEALVAAVEAAKRWVACDDADVVPEGEAVTYEAMEAALARFE